MERIFYKTDVIDSYSGLPFYVFDTSYLPSPSEIDYNLFIPTLMQHLPRQPYVVILFSCGLNKINWVWGVTFIKAFLTQNNGSTRNIENIHRIIAVHESWFVKSISQLYTNFLVSKRSFSINSLFSGFNPKNNILISCESLSDLSDYVCITQLKLSLHIYRHDYNITLSPNIDLRYPHQKIIGPSTTYSPATDPLFYHHFYQIFHILDTYGDKVEHLFLVPGGKVNTEILFYCLMRNQLLWINDWDLNCVASCFKKILTEIKPPLVPVSRIQLPIKDDFVYTEQIFNGLMLDGSSTVLFQILDLAYRMCQRSDVTQHTHLSILKSLCHALSHESRSKQNQDKVSIAVRFLKNVLHFWPELSASHRRQHPTVQQVINGENLADQTIDELYNMSFDTTVQDPFTSDEEDESKAFRSTDTVSTLNALSSQESLSSHVDSRILSNGQQSANGDKANEPDVKAFSRKLTLDAESPAPEKPVETNPLHLQFPPQKYRFEKPSTEPKRFAITTAKTPPSTVRKPVIRGRKVGELTKLFEERGQAMAILETI